MYVLKFRFAALLAILFVALFTQPLLAADNLSDLINKAGMQRMLSQRIAKTYFYLGNDILTQNNKLQLEAARGIFQKNHNELKSKVKDSEVQAKLSIVEVSFSKFNGLVTQPYNKENATQVLDLSESLLVTSNEVVLMLEELSGLKTDHIINISGKQRMLSQRISKYYIAYHSGFHDENTVQQLKNAVEDFNSALNLLQSEGRNTEQINRVLTKMKNQWGKISPFFLDVRKGGLPIMVLTTTDEITTLANEVTGLYVKVAPSN